MKIGIVTERNVQHAHYWDVVYEWEDIFLKSEKFSLIFDKWPSSDDGIIIRNINRILKFFAKYKKFNIVKGKLNLAFIMRPNESYRYKLKSIIPIYLDVSENDFEHIIYETQKLPVYFVTALETCNRLRKLTGNNKCEYIPLSVSDMYVTDTPPSKYRDVIQLGRKNNKLHQYMLNLCEESPDIEYIYQVKDTNNKYSYYSTQKGNIGSHSTRQEFISLLQSAKVSLLSTPSIDENKKFGNLDFFTPRFYESAVFFCKMVGRYSINQEAEILGIQNICVNVNDYNTFKDCILNALNQSDNIDINKYTDFIEKNKTSERIKQIMKLLKKHNIALD